MGMGGQCDVLAALPQAEKPSSHCIGDLVGPRAGAVGCGKPYYH